MENMNDFGGSGFWIFALLVLLGMGGNGFGFGGNGRCATIEDMNNTSNFARLENQVRANADLTERKADAISNGLCSGFYQEAQLINGLDKSISGQIQALSTKIDQNKIETLQAQIQKLETQTMLCNIPRVNPYYYGITPYNQCGCGGYNI